MLISELRQVNKDEYNTDKFDHESHFYNNFYNPIFEKIKDKEINILEIGIFEGGSLKLYHDYFPNALIVGMDIKDNWKGITKETYKNRIFTHYKNAYANETLSSIKDKYDFIIDDGSHIVEDQIYFLNNYSQFLKEDGYMVLEDIAEDCLERILNATILDKDKITVYNYAKETGRWDDILIVYKK